MNKAYIAQLRPQVMAVRAILSDSENADDMKALAILNILLRHWSGTVKVTQQDIVNEVTNLGHHELWEIRRGASNDSTLRKVRSLIEKVLRKQHALPVISTPGKGQTAENTAGYWLVRDRHEAAEYVERREAEIEKTVQSARETLAAVRRVCQI